VLSTVFPNPAQPLHGLFVFERARHMPAHAEVVAVAPVSWMIRLRHRVPYREVNGNLTVIHPTYFYVPGIMKALDGLCLFLSTLWAIRTLQREFPFDLIDSHFSFPEGFAAVMLGRWFRCPVTITLRGTIGHLSVQRLRRLAISWALRNATRLIAVGHPLAALAVSLGADPARVDVIPNGVDTRRFSPVDRAEARATLGLPAGGRLIVSAGHLSPRKGFDRVLRVMPDLLADMPDLSFAIVGGAGVERDNIATLERLVRESSLESHVIFTGAQPPEQVALWMNAADVFVLASDNEGCPNVVWEALACGRAVVASKVGETDRMVPAYAGVLFDDAHDLPALRESLRQALQTEWDRVAIREHAAAHTWPRVAERVFAQWRKACDVQGGDGAAPRYAPAGGIGPAAVSRLGVKAK